MGSLIAQRILWMIPTLLIVSILSFAIIQLPPGDYLDSYVSALELSGDPVSESEVKALRQRYALDRPFVVQYLSWMKGIVLEGDFGMSFEWNRPVSELIGERILLTSIISICTLLLTWAIAIPIGIYSAVRQYSAGDYIITFLGFIGVSTPGFLLALIFMYASHRAGIVPGGLFSPQYANAPWSPARFADLLAHMWVPVVLVGVAGTAGLIRVMRGNLLDELRKQYVLTARAKGLRPGRLLLKYPVRVAINPVVSTIGWLLPGIVSGSVITAVVLSLPTTGPLLLRALTNQDMYLAGSMVMMLSMLTVVGTLISDLLLLWLDPRIRYERQD